MNEYDSLLILSFGGPEGKEDVLPFLKNVLKGIPVKEETFEEIQERYDLFDGVSPINANTRLFIDALSKALKLKRIMLPIYWGNRNWHPMLSDTMQQMKQDGRKKTLVFVTSIFSSYSGCRKYREDLYESSATIEHSIEFDKIRNGYNHPGFIKGIVSCINETIKNNNLSKETHVFFTAHSLPISMAEKTEYQNQLLDSCQLVANELELKNWKLCYQSNNASYGNKWLEPTIEDEIVALGQVPEKECIVVPIGFVCDHMEVVLDLDIDAKNIALENDVNLYRAPTLGINESFIDMVVDLIDERIQKREEKKFLGERGPNHNQCPIDCCLSGRPGNPKPSLCGEAS